MKKQCVAVHIILLLLVGAAYGQGKQLSLASLFADDMVLQRETDAAIWGKAAPNKQVSIKVSWSDDRYQTTADGTGQWQTRINTPKAGGPFRITVQSDKEAIELKNVLSGEVWICSGQSNMQWRMRGFGVDHFKDDVVKANYPQIRYCLVNQVFALEPQSQVKTKWSICSPTTVLEFSAVAYFFASRLYDELKVPIGLISTNWGGSSAEAWVSKEVLRKEFPEFNDRMEEYPQIIPETGVLYPRNKKPPKGLNHRNPSVLYNNMIEPLIPFTMRGVIWYQGESNVKKPVQYRSLFPALIRDWRDRWSIGDFPFYYVQIAPFAYKAEPIPVAYLREAQWMALSEPNTGMAVTMDIGDITNIHPKNKKPVGERLALLALAKDYGKTDIVYSGPSYKGYTIEGNKLRLAFDHVGSGLVSSDGKALTHFTIAGADKRFDVGQAVIDGDTIVVSSEMVSEPVTVRFGWGNADKPNLANKEGLPASSFRTDDWPIESAVGTKTAITTPGGESLLWYEQPAEKWIQALPVGNGKLGGMVFGKIHEERIQLNIDTLWAGPPKPTDTVGARQHIDEARQLIFEGKYSEAQNLVQNKVMGPRISPRSYQTLGNLKLRFNHAQEINAYRRSLNLRNAIATTTFKSGGVNYSRDVFSSAVDDCLVVRLSADKPGMVSFHATLDRPADFVTKAVGEDRLVMTGQASHKGKHKGVRFEAQLTIKAENGETSVNEDTLTVAGADAVTLYLTAATDYNMDDPSKPLTTDQGELCLQKLNAAMKKPYATIQRQHSVDYRQFFNRFSLDLGRAVGASKLATDKRLAAVKKGSDDPGLVSLYCQYGRYLLISSSRPGCMPANLQGIWNEHLVAPWNSDYHININMQMNYWPAEVMNLSECHLPFFDFSERLLPSARKTAQEMLGSRGAAAGHTSDAWLWTTLIGKVQYGMWPMGLAWNTQHFMEHYRFTGDREFLAKRAYPILKESAEFFLGYLTEDPRSGKLVSGPTTSPENKFIAPDGKVVNLDMGVSMDQEIIWDNFTNCLEAAAVLGIEDAFVAEVRAALKRLALPQIGSDGRLMEWSKEFEEKDAGHRHVSHLYAIHPGKQYTLQDSPEMVTAARKSIEYRLSHGGGHTGWSRAWIINFWARFQDGQKAYENVQALLAKSTHPNMFDSHPPFQIDGNFGGAAGVAEMLIQSHAGEIELLPALPKAWKDGSVRGLRTRGGFEINMQWQGGQFVRATVTSLLGQPCRIRTNQPIDIKGVKIQDLAENCIEFSTIPNRTYSIVAIGRD